ncbi:Predicted flavoprotein CzcO associated with the cation diffusion facilitator CzcD [Pedococcus dokdonensis]|uniref:Predicted flavoprotein CzcO associated with the cation diffusion facilitator CzcD n=1 Tax=Pedococcus dokdonensis TaxID=443156 RepID=A0A1H0S6W2_9MICO|nr:NAD(P)/FAD-dependent oxidoreductase [Pedococcus dokdonensis]SDP37385.1 Predicted flavoprotein CzcO associated with the cation diffusion facilitator CzcD [Pedococcus dokdonensis]
MATPHHRVAIVGTGFSGLGMAIRLAQRGDTDYVVLEKADEVGGTWRDNRYPGCACDVPSRLYSFSFAQFPRWSRDYASAGEIWSYLRAVADRYAVRDRIEFGADLRAAEFDEQTGRWTLTVADGRQWTCDALVLGAGALHEPRLPEIEGLSSFAGTLAHTAQWPEGTDLTGQRVGVVGTGASAVQLVPAVAPVAAHTTVFQRTAAWTMSKRDEEWSPARQRLFARWPAVQRLVRWRTYWSLEARAPLFVRFPGLARLVERIALRELAAAVPDPVTRAALTPHYRIGCKRILLSDDYWPSFARSDVSLVTDSIVRVEPDAVVTADGTRHEVDVLVLGTGFDVSGSLDRIEVRGLDGRTLADAWSHGMHTHLGITVAGFPELYLLLGPNTGLGHNSVVTMIEFATDYVLKAIDRGRGGPRVTTQSAQDAFTREMLRRSRHTIWTTGCRSWYLDRFGHNTALWPGSTVAYWARTRRVDESSFETVGTHSRAKESIDAQGI